LGAHPEIPGSLGIFYRVNLQIQAKIPGSPAFFPDLFSSGIKINSMKRKQMVAI